MRKSILKLAMYICSLFLFGGCFQINNTPVENKNLDPWTGPITLARRIYLSEIGGSIDMLTDVEVINESEQTVINKTLTIAGSSQVPTDMKKARLSVSVPGVVLKNLTNIAEIVVQRTVLDGSFTLENCNVDSITLYGGGSHGLKLTGTRVARLNISFDNVNVELSQLSSVSFAYVVKNCQFTALDNDTEVSTIFVDSETQRVELHGGMTVRKFVSRSEPDAEPLAITVDSSDAEVEKAGGILTNGLLRNLEFEVIGEEVEFDTPGTMTKEELSLVEKEADSVALPPNENEKSDIIDIDNPGPLTLSNSTSGIQVKTTVPIDATQVDFYRAENGTSSWKLVCSCVSECGAGLPSTVSLIDYYIEKGKAYKYYAIYRTKGNGFTLKTSETDTLTALRGLGELKSSKTYTLHYDGSLQFDVEGGGTFPNLHEPELSRTRHFYFKKTGEDTSSSCVEPSKFSCLTLDEDDVPHLQFLTLEHIGLSLEILSSSVEFSQVKQNVRYSWNSLPAKVTAGRGFKKSRVTFGQDAIPIAITQATKGLILTVNPACLENTSPLNRIALTFYRKHDSGAIFLCPPDDAPEAQLGLLPYTFAEEGLALSENDRISCAFGTYDAETDSYDTFAEVLVFERAKKGGHPPVLDSTFCVNSYNPHSMTACIPRGTKYWFTRKTVVPDTYAFTVDGDAVSLPCTETLLTVGYRNRDYSRFADAEFARISVGQDDAYVSNLFSQLYDERDVEMFPYSTKATARFGNDAFRVEYIPFEKRTVYPSGLPEKFSFKDVYSDKSYVLPSGGTVTFSDVTKESATVTGEITNKIGKKLSYTGTADFSTNIITAVSTEGDKDSWYFAIPSESKIAVASLLESTVFVRTDQLTPIEGSAWMRKVGNTVWTYSFEKKNVYNYLDDDHVWSSGTWSATDDAVMLTPKSAYSLPSTFIVLGALLLTDSH